MAITAFQREQIKGEKAGRLKIRVRIKDNENNILFDRTRFVLPKKKNTLISIGFDWLKKGGYNIIVDVLDVFTGKTLMHFLQPQVL